MADRQIRIDPLALAQRIIKLENQNDEQQKLINEIAQIPNSDIIIHIGKLLYKSGSSNCALKLFLAALPYCNKPHEIHAYIAAIYEATRQLKEGIVHAQKATRLSPNYAPAFNTLGDIYLKLGQYKKAEQGYKKSIEHAPNNGTYHNNLARLYERTDQRKRAGQAYSRALKNTPSDPIINYNYACYLQENQQREQAVEFFKKAIELKPNFNHAKVTLLHQIRHLGIWDEIASLEKDIKQQTIKAIENKQDICLTPFACTTSWDDLYINLKVAQFASQRITQRASHLLESSFSYSHKKNDHRITLGYLSNDYYDHATAHLIARLFELHDRKRFKVVALSYGKDDKSSYRKKLENDCDEFIDLSQHDPLSSAKLINKLGIDILVDLKGHTKGARLEIPALRPAPIQITYLGFPGTSGADFFDYIITDKIVSPTEDMFFFSETPIYMPHTYQITDNTQEISKVPTRASCGLPEDRFVFCCFNSPYKIEPHVFGCWIKILQQTSNSVLWLLKTNERAEIEFKKQARRHGIDPARLIFANTIKKPGHLARLQLADLALDTWTCTGHTTTTDALWAGLPVLTFLGKHFTSRVPASLLSAIGLNELICKTETTYLQLAKHYASNPRGIANLKNKLKQHQKKYPLFNTPLFVKNLEHAYEKAWKNKRSGKPPSVIEI